MGSRLSSGVPLKRGPPLKRGRLGERRVLPAALRRTDVDSGAADGFLCRRRPYPMAHFCRRRLFPMVAFVDGAAVAEDGLFLSNQTGWAQNGVPHPCSPRPRA